MTLNWRKIIQYGLVGGLAIIYICLVGMVETFDERAIVSGILTLGRTLIFGVAFTLGYMVAWKLSGRNMGQAVVGGVVAGLIAGLVASLLIVAADTWNIREMFTNASPALIKIMTFSQETQVVGLLILIGA